MKREVYTIPEAEVIEFETKDIITTSGETTSWKAQIDEGGIH